ncbi:mucin-17-like [Xenopus tropicalis]|uniref:Mucin-17-like n=1 Tax=Xenopus tropicalis TaxID=8364 RepID=A0A8J1JBT6_XENTR|nr:mucin-17-like [Xenopus tropicalis]
MGTLQWALALLILICGFVQDSTVILNFAQSSTTSSSNGTVTDTPPFDNTTSDFNGTVTTDTPPPDNSTNDFNGTVTTDTPPPDNSTNDVNGTVTTDTPPPDNTTNDVNGTVTTDTPPPDNTTNDVNGTVTTDTPPFDNTTNDVNGTVTTDTPPPDNTTNDVNGTVTTDTPSFDNTTNDFNGTVTTDTPSFDNTTNDVNGTVTTDTPSFDNTTNDFNGTVTTDTPSFDNTTNDFNGTVTTDTPSFDNTTNDFNGTVTTDTPPSDNTTNDVNGTVTTDTPPFDNTTNDFNGTVTTDTPSFDNTTNDFNGTVTTDTPPFDNTTSISSSTTSTNKGHCVNGHLIGSLCVCDENFHGSRCESISNDIRPGGGPFIAKAKVTVVVSNMEYSANLTDKESDQYRAFEDRFQREMGKLYQSIADYVGVRITSIKPGSVVVEHEVLLTVDLISGHEQYNNSVRELKETLIGKDSTSNAPGFLEFNASRTEIQDRALDVTGLCSEFIPEEMRQYFYGVNESNSLLCASNCSAQNPEFFDCNAGQCSVSTAGPHCYCQTSGQFWYTGERCGTSVSKAGVIAGVTVGLIALAIIIITLAIIICRCGKNKAKERLTDNEQLWYEGWDGERFNKGQLRNSGSESNSTSGIQNPEYYNLDFKPALDKVDPHIKSSVVAAAYQLPIRQHVALASGSEVCHKMADAPRSLVNKRDFPRDLTEARQNPQRLIDGFNTQWVLSGEPSSPNPRPNTT